ncbi:collagen alpha-1(III) chain-like [Neocloeon triangulifer]|uniref:collagen alpha-1(III) chain-like n=1 Tax=Neocloeon triangulifer TaxID=2078957 RepID=UPI00286F5B3A|nr:collagen alpha-1(III) chain-like [Neocloeon triangulifer]
MWPETMPPSAAVPLLTIVTLALGAVAVSAREWPDLQQLAFRTPEIKSRGYHGSHIHSLSDFKFKIIAHRDGKDKACYLQSIAPGNLRQNLELYKNILYEKTNIKRAQNAFVTAPGSLSKSQVLHLAGNKIARFCRGFTTMILLPGPPNVIVNDFPESEENKEKEPKLPKYLKEQILMKRREKRSAKGKKKYQGQTQVQTISTGGDQPNLAEGVSQKNTSIAKVSTHRGMSQAQSQSAYEEDCDTCGDRHTPQRQPYPDAFAPGSYSPGGIPPSNVAHQPGFQQRGQTFGPGGQIYGPDGRPTQPAGSQGLRPGEYLGPDGQIYGPDGRPLGSRGNGQRPGGQGYGQNGQQVRPGGPILRPGEYFGPGGQIYGPDGRPITPGQGLRPGERGGQIFGPDGRPIYPGQGQRPDALGPGGQIYGPDGRPRTSEGQGSRPGGSDGQQLGPAGQVYGPGGRPVVPGGQYLRPGETLGPGGQIYGPDGRPDVSTGQRPGEGIAPGGQSYGPDGRPQVPGGQALRPGETYGTGGQLFSPDGRPLTSGGQGTGGQQFGPGGQIFQPGQILRPGETLGPGGQVYGPDGRPTINGGKRPGESFIPGGPGGKPFGETLGPGGQILFRPSGQPAFPGGQQPGGAFGPDGRPTSLGNLGAAGGEKIYGPDSRQITPQIPGGQRPGENIGTDGRPLSPGELQQQPGLSHSPSGQIYGPDGRPITQGGQKFHPNGQPFDPQGQRFQPGGQNWRPGETGGQIYGPDGRPIISGASGGQILGPDGRPLSIGNQGLQPVGSLGPDGRPYSNGQNLQPGYTVTNDPRNPLCFIYCKTTGPDGRIAPGQGQRPGDGLGSYGTSYGPDGRPIYSGQKPFGSIGSAGPGGRPSESGELHPSRGIYGPSEQQIGTGQNAGSRGQNLRPGETLRPGGQIYGPDGRPVGSGGQNLRPGETLGPGGQIYGPDGRPIGTGGQNLRPGETLGPGGQIYGPDGRPIRTGGQTLRPGETLGPGGQIYGPDGRPVGTGGQTLRPGETLGPGGQIYGPDGRPVGTGGQTLRPGETLGPGGQIYGPDGRPVGTGGQTLRPGETLGPGGQIYGPDGRPVGTGGQTLRPGETLGPGGQIYGPDGRPVGTGGQNLRPGETLRPGGESYGPDGRPIAPGGQVYGADGRPLTTGVYNGGQRNGNFGNEDGQTLYPGNGRQQLTNGAGGTGNQFPYQPGTGGQQFGANGGRYGNGAPPQGIGSPYGPNYGQGQQNIYNPQLTGQQYNPNGNQYGLNGQGVSNYPGGGQPNGLYNQNGYNNLSPGLPGEVGQNVGPDGRPLIYGSSTGANLGTPGAQSGGTDGSLTHGSPLDLNRSIPGVDDDGHSQVDVSVVQENNETIASSLSQGRFGGGKTQTSVSGSYKGGGSFSAQAQTIDGKRGAQSQVVGGDDGASSSGQAFGGKGQSQSQISLSTDTGLTSASSQTTGNNYGTQSEVQAGETGGNSVAQASGIGKTSSQAQVKFKPYDSATDDDSQKIVFRGGGSASAQTGPRTGVSQSKIHGSFKHGISYSGVAQASSGSKDELERDGLKPLDVINLNATSDAPNKVPARRQNSPPPATSPSTTTTTNAPLVTSDDDDDDYDSAEQESLPGTTEVPRRTERGDQPSTHLENSDDLETSPSQSGVQPYPYVTRIDLPPGDLEHGYLRQRQESDGRRDHSAFSVNNFKQEQYQSRFQQQPYQRQTVTVGKPVGSVANPQGQSSGGNQPSQSQSVILGDLGNTGVRVMQDADGMGLSNGEVLQPGQSVPGRNGYSIPSGFRGRVVGSSAGNNGARASSDRGGQAQTQTVILTPEPGKFEYKGPNGLENKAADNADYDEYEASQESEEEERQPLQPRQRNYGAFQAPPTSFVSVTQKVSSQAPYSSPRELEHTYYTKASKCGYYTFSCQIVEGSNGRAKVCKPKFNMDDKNCN